MKHERTIQKIAKNNLFHKVFDVIPPLERKAPRLRMVFQNRVGLNQAPAALIRWADR